jgi:hypothetical protein
MDNFDHFLFIKEPIFFLQCAATFVIVPTLFHVLCQASSTYLEKKTSGKQKQNRKLAPYSEDFL